MIELIHISKVFGSGPNACKALENVNLTFNSSGLVVIMGPSGCGKSTLLNIIALLDRPTSGKYELFGKKTSEFSNRHIESHYKNTFAYLFQHFYLLEGFSAFDNVLLPLINDGYSLDEARYRIPALFATFGIAHLLNRPVETLSGGESQRVALLRAIAKKSPIILGDEPTGALDSRNGVLLMETLKEISKQKLVIIVTHDRQLALSYADRIIDMDNGQIVKDQVINITPALECKASHKKAPAIIKTFLWKFMMLARKSLTWSLISLVVGIITTILTIGMAEGTSNLCRDLPLETADARIFYFRTQHVLPLENTPLNLISYERPLMSEAQQVASSFPESYLDVSFKGLLGELGTLFVDGQPLTSVQLIPLIIDELFDNSSFDTIYMNKPAADIICSKRLDQENSLKIDYQINLETKFVLDDERIIRDAFDIHHKFMKIKEIDDRRFNQEAIVFYDYFAAKKWLDNKVLPNLSAALQTEISWYRRLLMATPFEAITNLEYMLILANDEQVKDMYDRLPEDERYSWSSAYIQEREILGALTTTINLGLSFFTAISALVSVIMMMLTMVHIMAIFRRRLAIMWQLGTNFKQLKHLLISIGRFQALIACALSVLVTLVLQPLLNKLFAKIVHFNNIIAVPWKSYHQIVLGLPILIFLIVFVTSEITTRLVMRSLASKNLIEELRDAD